MIMRRGGLGEGGAVAATTVFEVGALAREMILDFCSLESVCETNS